MDKRTLFISHSSEDRDVAMHVLEFLEERGLNCWISHRDILPSADWAESIIDAVDSSSGMVVLVSRGSNTSPQVRREVERAVDRGIPLYPLLLERVKLSKWMQYYISAHQWNDATDVSLGTRLDELFAALQAAAEEDELDLGEIKSQFQNDLEELSAELDASRGESERLLHGERRRVSILHASVSLPGREIGYSVRKAVIRTVVNLLERYARFYRGSIEQISLCDYRCVFGLEQVHEDDSRRAVSCGIALMKGFYQLNSMLVKKNVSLEYGIGIASGLVRFDAVCEISSGGEVMLEAEELAGMSTGSILVSEAFRSALRDTFSWEEHSPGVFSLTDQGDSLSVRELSIRSPFVGREGEMVQLSSMLNSSGEAGHLAVGITGEAGIGKSRLVNEFLRIHCSSDKFLVLSGQTLSFAQPPYWAWTSLLRNALEVQQGDELGYEEFLSLLGSENDSLLDSAPFLASLLSIDSGDPRLSQLNARALSLEIRIAFRNLLEVLSARGRLVVVLEDVHWLDQGDREVLEFVYENCRTELPILFLLVCRPETEEGASVGFNLSSGKGDFQEIKIGEFDETASMELAAKLFAGLSASGTEGFSSEVKKLFLDRSGGNPFFLEELLFDLVERDFLVEDHGEWVISDSFGDVIVPDSLIGLLQSRLERLPESWRSVLQNSSVLGMEFQLKLYWKLLSRLYMGRCHSDVFDGLERKKMLVRGMSASERKYLFRHILVHDTAYSSILEPNLKKLHRAAAESIQEMLPGELERISGILMHHYDMAQDRIRAIEWGFKAMRQYTGKELLKISLRIETLLEEEYRGDELQEKIFKTLSYREQAFEVLGEREEQQLTINRMVEIAESRESDYLMAIAVKKRGVMAMFTGRLQDAISDLEEALELIRKVEDLSFEGIVLGNLGGLCLHQGRIKEAENYLERAIEIHREVGDLRSEGVMVMNMGIISKARGRMDEARALYDDAIQIARKIGDRRTVADVLGNVGTLLWTMGLLDESEKYQKDSLAIQREIGNRRSEAVISVNLGVLCMNQKRYEEASEYYEKGLAVARSLKETILEGNFLGNMGVLYAEQGRDDTAGEYYEMSLEIHRRLGNKKDEAIVLSNLGGIQYRLGNMAEALNFYNESLRINNETGNEAENGAVYTNLGCVYFQKDDIEEAYSCYIKSAEIAVEMKQGIQNYDGIKDLRLNLLASGYSHEELPWPDHWEPYLGSAPSPEESS